ncbi:unnamed protein product [Malus baccata var. baccata]
MTTHESFCSLSFLKLWKYDVFLSFRGEDTRNGFTGHLHAALKEKGYEVFIDEDDLNRGEEIKEALFRAIEESRISVIVFSKRYADSSWCLDELVKIMECRDKLGQHVLPIFYEVEVSDIRKQNGCVAEAFQKYEEGILEEKGDKEREAKEKRVKQWRRVLTQAANLSGQVLRNGHEAKLIRRIVDENIWEWLPRTNELDVAKHPVGINSRVQPIISYILGGGSNDVLIVGIWGMGGLGKTTAAKAIYNQIHHKFQFKSFLADVCDVTSRHGLVYLQEKLVSDILKQTKSGMISSVDAGINVIKQHLQRRKVLVIIDNIDKVSQLNAIAGNRGWFGPGSKIIITTRDEHLLKRLKVNEIYSVQKMNEKEALELFSWHAFENYCPIEEYHELSKKVVSYCRGLPLALEVLGSFLIDRSLAEWESQLEKLERIPEGEIIKKLKISFDGLDATQKAIFLDISCFFIGMDKDYVTKILDGCGFSTRIGISVLRERCLVTVESNKLKMHDLFREMGKLIIYEESPTQPEKWSRLWGGEEVTDVLINKSGTEAIEGLALDLYSSENATFSTEAFTNMKKLRLLKLNHVELTGDYKHFPKKLIWLSWHGFPLKSIPDDLLNQPKLIAIDLQYSRLVQGWKDSKLLEKLKILNLSGSVGLTKSPDFSNLPNLEELIFQGCTNLSDIHPSIGHLKRLSFVDFGNCVVLRYLPGDFYTSKSVETLVLNGCLEFRELHEGLGGMVSLKILQANHTLIRQVPSSVVRLKNLVCLSLRFVSGSPLSNLLPPSVHGLVSLRKLYLSNCNLTDDAIPKDLGSLFSLEYLDLQSNSFHSLPTLSGLSKLETFCLNDCTKLCSIPDLPTNLEALAADGCPALVKMTDFSEMSNMRELLLSDSHKLTEVPGLAKSLNSMTRIRMEGCTNLTADFRKSILQGWTSCGVGGIFLNGIYDIPEWFEFVDEGHKVSFDIPHGDGHNFKGLTLCCRVHSGSNKHAGPLFITVINCTKHTALRASITYVLPRPKCEGEEDYFWQGQLSNDKLNLLGGDKMVILVEHDYVRVKKTGVNLTWDKPMKENMHNCYNYMHECNPRPDWLRDEAEASYGASDDDQITSTTDSQKWKRKKTCYHRTMVLHQLAIHQNHPTQILARWLELLLQLLRHIQLLPLTMQLCASTVIFTSSPIRVTKTNQYSLLVPCEFNTIAESALNVSEDSFSYSHVRELSQTYNPPCQTLQFGFEHPFDSYHRLNNGHITSCINVLQASQLYSKLVVPATTISIIPAAILTPVLSLLILTKLWVFPLVINFH